MTARVLQLRATSSQHYAAADLLRHWAALELGRDPRRAAQLYSEAKVLRAEGDGMLRRELEMSVRMTGGAER